MKITPNQVFLHGGVRYEPGQDYDVDPVDGGYFVHNGWADSDAMPTGTAPAEVDLEVHGAVHEATAEIR